MSTHLFIIGAKPRTAYDIEVDDQELTELDSDAAGILELDLPGQDVGVYLQQTKRLQPPPNS